MFANSLTASFPYYWSKRYQAKHNKIAIYRDIASFEEEPTLVKGERVYRPYRSTITSNALGSEGSYTRQDITDTEEHLDINVERESTFYVRDPDAVQSNYRTANSYADDCAVVLTNWIDGDVLGEYASASSVVGAYEVAGTGSASDGIGVTASASNVYTIFSKASTKLDAQNVKQSDRWAIISPQFKNVLWEYLQSKDTPLGDEVSENGLLGGAKTFCGFRLYLSNNCAWSARLEFGTNPTANDTVVVNGVTFTWKADTITTAGYVHIASDAAHSLAILVAAINTPGTSVTEATDAGFYAVSAASQILLKGITATDNTTYMTLKGEGVSYCAVSETLSATADIWTTTKQIQHQLFGQGKPIDVVVQQGVKLQIKDRDGYIGKDFVSYFLYGLKTFAEGAVQLVDVQIRSDAY